MYIPFQGTFCTDEIKSCDSFLQMWTNFNFTQMKFNSSKLKLTFVSNAKINFRDMKYISYKIYILECAI